MKILYNFFITLKRYTLSAVLNIIGLSLAFAIFIVLFEQYKFEHGYDTYNRNANRTYRLKTKSSSNEKEFAIFSQQIIDKLSDVSPHIQSATLYEDVYWNNNVKIRRDNGALESFFADFSQVYPSFVEIADIRIIEGDPNALDHPWNAIIPESVAKKMFPDESPIGKTFETEVLSEHYQYTIGAVYKDIPANSVFSNCFYYTKSTDEKAEKNQFNYMFLITIDKPTNLDKVLTTMNASLQEYFDDEGSNNTREISADALRGLYYVTGIYGDFNNKGNKMRTNLMLIVAILILLIATINYINFASSMAPLKMKMINAQRIMGANVWRLRLSVMLESVLIALLSFGVALLIVTILSRLSFADLWIADISLGNNLPTIGIVAILTLVVGMLAGIYPAFYMTSFRPVIALRGSFAMSNRGRAYRNILIGCQYVISFILIICALFVNLQNKFISQYDFGYDKEQIAVAKINADLYNSHDALSEELKSNAEIEDVAYADSKLGNREFYQNWGMEIKDVMWDFNLLAVSNNFLDVMGIPVVEGRNFREEDKTSEAYLLIFNCITPKKDHTPLNFDDGDEDFKVIGFFDPLVHLQTLYVEENPFAFLYSERYNQNLSLPYLYVKIGKGIDKAKAVVAIQKSIKKINPTFNVEVDFLDQQLNDLYKKDQRICYLTTYGSILAIIISLIGVFGIVLFESQFRRREIGVRRVHGATVKEILLLFNKKFVIMTLICFVIAIPVSIYAVQFWLSNFHYRIPIYVWVFVVALVVVLFITIVTVTLCSWKAAYSDPAKSIKVE